MDLENSVSNITTTICAVGVFLNATYLGVTLKEAIESRMDKLAQLELHHYFSGGEKPTFFNAERLYNKLYEKNPSEL
jgi:hypothetical protein